MDLFARQPAPRGAAMPETHPCNPRPEREPPFHVFLRHAGVSLSSHETQEQRVRRREPIGAHVPRPARLPLQKPYPVSGQDAGAIVAAPVVDPLPELEAALGVWCRNPRVTLPCDECAQTSQTLVERSASGIPLPAAHRLESLDLRSGKAFGTALMPPMADPPAELKPSLHVLGGYVCMTFPSDEALQMAEPFCEASLERVPRPPWEPPPFVEHTDLLRAQETEPVTAPVVRRAVAEREVAYSIRVEDAGVSSLADVAVEQLEKLLEGYT